MADWTLSSHLFATTYWGKQQPQQVAICYDSPQEFPPISSPHFLATGELRWQDLPPLIQRVTVFFPPNATRIAYQGEDKLLALLGYLAAIASQRQILLLNPALTAWQTEQIIAEKAVDFLATEANLRAFLADNCSPNASQPPSFNADLPATLTLTSGSTGVPKAVVHTVRQHLSNAEGVCELMNFAAKDRWLLSLPLFHVSGQGIVWRWLLKGATLVINKNKANFHRLLASCSHASLVPTQLQRYLTALQTDERLTWQCHENQQILLGGAMLPPELIQSAQQAQIRTFSGYGMTEMASTICAVENLPESPLNTVGTPLSGREIKLVNDEIWVRGESLALGYLQKNGEISPPADSDGWFHTQDRGQLTATGELMVLGRLDNLLISGGENIQPEAVERVLFQSGQVEAVFVVPRQDAEFGHRPVALVDFYEPFSEQEIEKLRQFAALRLEKFKQPVDYLPLNAANWQRGGIKISRQHLINWVAQHSRISTDE